MKKILSFALVVVCVLGLATIGFSEVNFTRGPDSRVSTYVTVGTAAAAGTTLTTLTTSNRILGFVFSDSAAGSVGLYDDSSVANMVSNGTAHLVAEASCAAGTVVEIMFPLPYAIQRGIVVHTSAATTGVCTIFYE